MVLLLKTPRPRLLRFQLLLGLLLALGTAPRGSEGEKLKCYKCPSDGCESGSQDEVDCAEGEYCFKESGSTVDRTQPSPRQTNKGCRESKYVKCFEDKFGYPVGCGIFEKDIDYSLFTACDKLETKNSTGRGLREEKKGITMCHCNTNLCNPAGHPTPNKMLTLMIPTIYGGVAGVYL